MDKFNSKISQAFINEFKGNLFEFLCAQNLSQKFGVENSFLNSLSPVFLNNLSAYEKQIRNMEPELIEKLRKAAKYFGESAFGFIEAKELGELQKIEVLGKINKSLQQDRGNQNHEGDILLDFGDQQKFISLKLCKQNSFVNTKSAGAYSIFKTYFPQATNLIILQNHFSETIQSEFTSLIKDLYDIKGLRFTGDFDNQWVESGYSELPGDQERDVRERIHQYYYRCLQDLFSSIVNLYKNQDENVFRNGLLGLCGFSNQNLIQVKCFHVLHDVVEVDFLDYNSMKENLEEIEILTSESKKSSLEISCKDLLVQLRIKPMNKFTVPGLKVNCSMRKLN